MAFDSADDDTTTLLSAKCSVVLKYLQGYFADSSSGPSIQDGE